MRGITLTQPWATMVALGAKINETRDKRSHYRGPLAIHAALGFQGLYGRSADVAIAAVCRSEPFRSVLLANGYGMTGEAPMREVFINVSLMPRGEIVALAELSECVPAEQEAREIASGNSGTVYELALGDYSPGRWAWLLHDVRRLSEPVTFCGNQTVFHVPDDVAARVLAACPA